MAVETKSQELNKASENFYLVESLWGGTRAMRNAGQTFLPREPGETLDSYENRKNRSTLTNVFKKTINTFAGRIFSERVRVDNAPSMQPIVENIDYEGRDLHRFSYDVCRYALRDGLRFIMVDMPRNPGAKTKAEEKALGIRPYWVEIDIRQVLGWKTSIVNGVRMFSQFRIMETVTESTGEFESKDVEQVRVIEPFRVRLYRKNEKSEFVLFEEILTTFSVVPVVPVYADRYGFMESDPPLLDIAWLNVEHWQKSSDQSNILHVARVPILHWAGYAPSYDEEGRPTEMVIGPNTLAKSPDASARLEYVEHSGAAIGAGRDDLADIEKRMEALGAEFVTSKKSGDITATEKAINESGDISELSAFAENFRDSLELAFIYTAQAMGEQFAGDVVLNSDIGVIHTPVNVPELIKLRAMGDVSQKTTLEILSDEWGVELDAEIEQENVSEEPPVMGV